MYKKIASLLLCTILVPTMQKANNTDPHIVITTIPKTGTFLLSRCIELITKKKTVINKYIPGEKSRSDFQKEKWFPSINDLTKKVCADIKKIDEFSIYHLVHTQEYAAIFRKNICLFTMIRDPRDQIVSRINWMRKFEDFAYNKMPDSQLISAFIGYPNRAKIGMKSFIMNHVIEQGSLDNIADLYYEYMPWSKEPNCYTVSFENLIGTKGGGNKELQEKEILNIAKHLNISLTKEDCAHIIQNLFGHGFSFNKGQIGIWKKYFTPAHKKQFKAVAGDLLIDLGYETDMNW